MSVLIYQTTVESDVKKAFDTLMVKFAGDKTQVLALMNENPIAVVNADVWEGELSQTIEIAKPWIDGEEVKIGMIRIDGDKKYVVVVDKL
jgi:hypothetical protein